ncbi:MAG TPA: methyl-accepting chemotaxis protein [Gammaproteobacteria bacterium]|nr:methyl-accepting chemotaxis protein [Gammaproteobacteria bacterium]
MSRGYTARATFLTYVVGFAALICLVLAAADFFFVAQGAGYDTEYFSELTAVAGESQALPAAARRAFGGDEKAFAQLAQRIKATSAALQLLANGDPATLMPAPKGRVAVEVKLLQQRWSSTLPAAQTILSAKNSILYVQQTAARVRAAMPVYVASWQKLIQQLAEEGRSLSLMPTAAAQPVLAEQTREEMEALLAGRGDLPQVSTSFNQHVADFGTVLDVFTHGSKTLKIAPLPHSSDLSDSLQALNQQYAVLSGELQPLAAASASIIAWHQALAALDTARPDMLTDITAINQAYQDQIAARPFKPLYGYIFGALALAFIILLVLRYQLTSEARRAARAQQVQNERNQKGILRLLDELSTLADGDLTVELAVTDDITGAIADSINYTIGALRELVRTIRDTAVEVDGAARQAEGTTSHLAEASENQSRQITGASTSITQMARAIGQVSANAEEASEVSRRSVEIAHKGGEAVRRTIEGMTSIREAIQDTAKRMKRLGESSQEIGDIVELIDEIAEQTNILSLNAAIQASTAGEAGRGFGVVADEVQRLAVRAASATRQIETLVRTIQSDTNEAIASMEQSTAGVVSRAELAENAGHALDEIESVSNDMAALIENISGVAREQAAVAGDISGSMGVIQGITSQTAEGSAVTARSIGKLAALAAELRRSVAGFRVSTEISANLALADAKALPAKAGDAGR